MLATPCYKGQGLGNFLANYVAVRCLALDKGYDFGVQFPENFKGSTFLDIDMGLPVIGGRTSVEGQAPEELPSGFEHYYQEATQMDGALNVSYYDTGFLLQKDNTLIHGLLQGVDYFNHRLDEVRNWLTVEPVYLPDNLCVINVRGGEYKHVPSFILPKSYWENGITHMKQVNPDMQFEVHTDDPDYARSLFPEYPIVSDIALNWRSICYANHLLLSNSSFAILPAYLGSAETVVAPMYWAGHNVGKWSLKQNYVPNWTYIL